MKVGRAEDRPGDDHAPAGRDLSVPGKHVVIAVGFVDVPVDCLRDPGGDLSVPGKLVVVAVGFVDVPVECLRVAGEDLSVPGKPVVVAVGFVDVPVECLCDAGGVLSVPDKLEALAGRFEDVPVQCLGNSSPSLGTSGGSLENSSGLPAAQTRRWKDGMPYLAGIILAFTISVIATLIGFDRDRAFYPTLLETLVMTGFLLVAAIGFKTNLWLVVGALAAHGVFDCSHGRMVANPGVPAWWPAFCLTYDATAAAFLAWLLAGSRIERRRI